MTSKQRAFLKSIASNEDTIFQLGKGGIDENFIAQVDSALEILRANGEDAYVIGEIIKGDDGVVFA